MLGKELEEEDLPDIVHSEGRSPQAGRSTDLSYCHTASRLTQEHDNHILKTKERGIMNEIFTLDLCLVCKATITIASILSTFDNKANF